MSSENRPKRNKKGKKNKGNRREGIQKLKYIDHLAEWVKEQGRDVEDIYEFTIEKLSSSLQTADVDEVFVGLEKLTNLRTLILSDLNLTKIPKQVFELKNLTILQLHNNKLSSIPPEIRNLQYLEYLDLELNQLNEIPQDLFKLSKLKTLLLDRNNISVIPGDIGQLRMLEELSLQYNPLILVPVAVVNLPNLKVLRVIFLQVLRWQIEADIFDCQDSSKFIYNDYETETEKRCTPFSIIRERWHLFLRANNHARKHKFFEDVNILKNETR